MLKKALLRDENRNQIEPRTRFHQFYVKTKKVCRCFASFSSQQKHFTHVMYVTAIIRPSDVIQVAQWATIAHNGASIMFGDTGVYDAQRQITLNLKQ